MSGLATRVRLPRADGSLLSYELGPASTYQRPAGPLQTLAAIAAAHVVADPLADNPAGGPGGRVVSGRWDRPAGAGVGTDAW